MPYSSGDRVLIVDALRGFAIILMLAQHFPYYLQENVSNSLLFSYAYLASRCSAPLFFLIAGYCVLLSAKRRIASSGETGFLTHIIGRGVSLFLLGYVINLLRFHDFLVLNVIHLIGVSVVFTGLLYLSKSRGAYLITLTVLLLYLFLGPSFNSYVMGSSPSDFIVWFMTSGEFPAASWIIYFFIGLGVGWFQEYIRFPQSHMVFMGEGLIILSLPLFLVYPPSAVNNRPSFMFLVLGVLLVFYHIIRYFARAHGFILNVLASYGRHSLRIYFTQHVILISIPKLLGFNNTLNVYAIILVFLMFFTIAYVVINKYESSSHSM
jgi:uncharacterized membrane protein